MKDNYLKIDVDSLTPEILDRVRQYIRFYPSYKVLLNYTNTSYVSLRDIELLEKFKDSDRIKIRIKGAYTDERIAAYSKEIYVDMHKYDNIYTLSEMKSILKEIELIEDGINESWSEEQKLIYFIGYLKNKIIYHPFFERALSHEIRSLRGIFTHKTVCAGYAMILKELCDRNGIYCEYVEGVCKKEDLQRDVLTHAWNIIKIKGYYIPVDLTWNANRNKSGKYTDIEDIANVNEFIKDHFPGRKERLQDYTILKSIDGKYLKTINNLINKDMTYDSSSMRCRRKDGEEFLVTQVEQRVIDNEYLYTYIYTKLRSDGSLGESILFYSKTNVAHVVSNIAHKKKLQDKLRKARLSGDTKEIIRLEDELKGSEALEDINYMIDNLLFSRENMSAAINRRDFYLGKIQTNNGVPRVVEGLFIDVNFAKKINKKSKTYIRSNGDSFVLEDWGTIKLSNGSSVFRYKLYEFVNINGTMVLKKNTIYTDEDILLDNRSGLINDFLDRKRLDRKLKETGGYLGYYSKNGVRTYIPQVNEIFKKVIYEQYRLKREHIIDYHKDIVFDDLRRMVENYEIVLNNGQEIVLNRYSKKMITDSDLVLQIKFAYIWLSSAGIKYVSSDKIDGYTYAFLVDSALEVYNLIAKCITDSINKFGNIDTVDILKNVEEKCGTYKYATDIVVRMFSHIKRIDIIRDIFMRQNPSSYISKNSNIVPLESDIKASILLVQRKKELEEQKKQVLEVFKRNGQIVIEPRGKK